MKTFLIAACIAGAALGAPAVSLAQPASATAATPAPSARKLELTRRYLAAIKFEETMKATMDGVMPAMMAQFKGSMGADGAKYSAAITESMSESLIAILPRMEDAVVPIYADAFTEKELTDLVAFYEGPTGQSVMAKSRALAPTLGPVMVKFMPELQADMTRRVCEKVDCKKK